MKLTRRRIRKRSSRVKRQKLGRKTKNRRKSFRKKRTKGRRRRRGGWVRLPVDHDTEEAQKKGTTDLHIAIQNGKSHQDIENKLKPYGDNMREYLLRVANQKDRNEKYPMDYITSAKSYYETAKEGYMSEAFGVMRILLIYTDSTNFESADLRRLKSNVQKNFGKYAKAVNDILSIWNNRDFYGDRYGEVVDDAAYRLFHKMLKWDTANWNADERERVRRKREEEEEAEAEARGLQTGHEILGSVDHHTSTEKGWARAL